MVEEIKNVLRHSVLSSAKRFNKFMLKWKKISGCYTRLFSGCFQNETIPRQMIAYFFIIGDHVSIIFAIKGDASRQQHVFEHAMHVRVLVAVFVNLCLSAS